MHAAVYLDPHPNTPSHTSTLNGLDPTFHTSTLGQGSLQHSQATLKDTGKRRLLRPIMHREEGRGA